jgi:hypothetical protein
MQIVGAGDAGSAGSVEQPELMAELERESAAGGADVAGAADEEEFHGQKEDRVWRTAFSS